MNWFLLAVFGIATLVVAYLTWNNIQLATWDDVKIRTQRIKASVLLGITATLGFITISIYAGTTEVGFVWESKNVLAVIAISLFVGIIMVVVSYWQLFQVTFFRRRIAKKWGDREEKK